MSEFAQRIVGWWRERGRRFPWRETADPYRIFVAEVMLHRTRAENVVSVYMTFLERFPNVASLASARPEEVMTVMAPLGLRWRSRMMIEAARMVMEKFGGTLPGDKETLMKLPGSGEYISSAVAIFSSGEPLPLLDTNIIRVVSRYLCLSRSDGSRRSRQYRDAVTELLDSENVSAFYYACIDLAALICKASKPECQVCPVMDTCANLTSIT
ncbi:DNA glycosylase [Cuniculiplasma sp. SKW4]|uniref:DNA glycosylase n=1 Tax=Cuniculiplasma sp. SKW4 TaxID=3400171 RepID=UPI003FCF5FDD